MGTSVASILVVDDEPDLRMLYELTLLREGHRVETAGSLAEARSHLQVCRFDVLITDMRLPDGLGMELLHDLRSQQRKERAIVMTAYGSAENAVEALRYGAFDYLTKPVDLKQFRAVVASAMEQQPSSAAPGLRSAAPASMGGSSQLLNASAALDRLVGTSAVMQQVKQRIQKVAPSMAPVLITGESGTGKELVARALHACSHRAHGPWVAVNCGAIPEHLLEAEFFGARKGAYTGATADREGFFSAARGGTLFLDEIGDMPFDLQTRLLRVLSDGQFYRVGGHTAVKSNVRVIAATHQNLEQRVKDGVFREDLFHRLNVIRLRLPSLRERAEDVPMLTKYFLQRSAKQLGVEPKRISEAALQRMAQFSFPGNVRQLENICHWLTVMAPAQQISVQDLPPEVLGGGLSEAYPFTSTVDRSAVTPTTTITAEAGLSQAPLAPAAAVMAEQDSAQGWESLLEAEARKLLQSDCKDVWEVLSQRFESSLIHTALGLTHGKRMEAALRLGIGRNTITRKIQELGLDGPERMSAES